MLSERVAHDSRTILLVKIAGADLAQAKHSTRATNGTLVPMSGRESELVEI